MRVLYTVDLVLRTASYRRAAEDPMATLKYRPAEATRHSSTDPFPFPERPVSRIGRWEPRPHLTGQRQVHPAEEAVDRVQRRLDNLRAALGPDYAREDDSPRAA
jgi:hypothetical protein